MGSATRSSPSTASWPIWSVVGASGGGLRVGEDKELGGLDLSEHGMEAYPEFVSTTNV